MVYLYHLWFQSKDKFQSIHLHSSPICPSGLGKLFLTEGWKQMRICLHFADVLERSFPEFPFGKSRSFDLHKSDCVFPFTGTRLIYILPFWLTSSWSVKNHSSNSRMTVSPFWLFFGMFFFMTTLYTQLFYPHDWLEEWGSFVATPLGLILFICEGSKKHIYGARTCMIFECLKHF